MAKRILYLIIGIAIIGIAVFVYLNYWYSSALDRPASSSSESVTFEVASGETTDSIATRLENEGLISSATIFKLYLRLENKGGEIQAGKFRIAKNLTIPDIVETLSNAKLEVTRVTIIEGYRGTKISETLTEAFEGKEGAKFTKSEFDTIFKSPDSYTFSAEVETFLNTYKPAGKSLEGFLYPDTYEFENSATALEVTDDMIAHFIEKTKDIAKDEDFYDDLILASIVERESFTNAERPLIASVFVNRLDDGWMLQSDATVNYATGIDSARTTNQERQIDSKYNTYKYTGLPPTPINSPRLESIKAAVDPAESDYYFFLHEQDGTGQVHFAKTFAEHNSNIQKYLN